MLPCNLLSYRIFRYAIAGGIAFIADIGILYGMTSFFGMNYLLSAAGGFIIGLTITNILSFRFVFADMEQSTNWTLQIFCFIGVIGLVLNEFIMGLFTECFGFHYMVSKMVSVALVFLWNYRTRRELCFRKKHLGDRAYINKV